MKSGQSVQEIRDILEILPQRYPFLLIDRILETDGKILTSLVIVKNYLIWFLVYLVMIF